MIVAVLVIAIAASALAVSHLTNERASFLRQRIPQWEVSNPSVWKSKEKKSLFVEIWFVF